jgi:hypothetical protein
MNHLQAPKKQTQSKPILKGMNVNFCTTGYYESKPTFAANNPNLGITTAWSSAARIRLSAGPNLGRYTTTLLQFSCAQQFLANTIYGILPNLPRQTLAAVSGVKMGLLKGGFFSISKTVFAANLYNFRLSQQLAK